jgi:hypothetical protein
MCGRRDNNLIWEDVMGRIRRLVASLGLGLVLVSSLLVSNGLVPAPVLAQVRQSQPVDDPAVLRELAEGLLTPAYLSTGGTAQQVQLLVGTVPAGFPSLPVPPGGRLVGSSLRTAGGELAQADVLNVAPGAEQEIAAFYEQALPPTGWTPPAGSSTPPSVSMGGFLPASPFTTPSATYCRAEPEPWLTLSVVPHGVGQSAVRASYQTRLSYPVSPAQFSGPCTPRSSPVPSAPASFTAMTVLPRLTPPPGIPLQGGGGTGSEGQATSEVIATTAMSPGELVAYFGPQLEAAGWVQQAGHLEGPVAYSLWTAPPAEPGEAAWQGTLIGVTAPGADRRRLVLRVESPDAGASAYTSTYYGSGHGSGGITMAPR